MKMHETMPKSLLGLLRGRRKLCERRPVIDEGHPALRGRNEVFPAGQSPALDKEIGRQKLELPGKETDQVGHACGMGSHPYPLGYIDAGEQQVPNGVVVFEDAGAGEGLPLNDDFTRVVQDLDQLQHSHSPVHRKYLTNRSRALLSSACHSSLRTLCPSTHRSGSLPLPTPRGSRPDRTASPSSTRSTSRSPR